MASNPRSARSNTLSLSPDDHWALHHVLLDRIDREGAAANATDVETPPLEAFQAFETLDDGGLRFTSGELEAMRDVLAQYQRSTTWWELERSRIERLLGCVTAALEEIRVAAN